MSTIDVNGVEKDQSDSIAELAAALAKAQGQIKSAAKDKTNPHFKSKYADLASVWDAIREPLSTNGLSVTQLYSNTQDSVIVVTMLLHASGQWIKSRGSMPVAQKTAQGFGSSLTYLRRYSLSALVGVAADEDDDGNAASRPGPGGMDALKEKVGNGQREAQPTPWEKVKALCAELKVSETEAGRLAKELFKKTKPSELTEEDGAKLLAAVKAHASLSKLGVNGAEVEKQ
jgi:hypothetical protein